MADEEEAAALEEAGANDFETYQESDFAEGDEYADGHVLQLTAERNDQVAQFDDHKDAVYCIDSLPVAPFNVFASGDGADKAYIWRLVEKTDTTVVEMTDETSSSAAATSAVEQPAAAEEEEKKEA